MQLRAMNENVSNVLEVHSTRISIIAMNVNIDKS